MEEVINFSYKKATAYDATRLFHATLDRYIDRSLVKGCGYC